MRLLKEIPIHPSFLLLVAWFVITGKAYAFFIFVGVVLTHELGHYFVAWKLGYKLDSFFLAPYGVSLNYKECTFASRDEIKIAIAGPAVNLILATITVSLWWIFPAIYFYTHEFVLQSVSLALFNLLPAYPLDGGRIFICLFSEKISRKKSVKIISLANLILAATFVIIFIVTCFINFNPTPALVAAFMLAGIVESNFESRYQKMNMFKKKIKSFSKVQSLVVQDSITLGQILKHIEANKFTVFYIVSDEKTRALDEKALLKLSLIYPLSLSLSEILKKLNI